MSRLSQSFAAPPNGIAPFAALRRRLRRAEDGASAVEFAIVAAPFLMLIFMLFETALVFFGMFALDNAVAQAARLIRTGQAQEQGFGASEFKNSVCEHLTGPFDCDKIELEVRSFPTFGDITPYEPAVDENGNVRTDFAYEPGTWGEVVAVRVLYEYEIVGKMPEFAEGWGLGNMPNGNRLLESTRVFRNEP